MLPLDSCVLTVYNEAISDVRSNYWYNLKIYVYNIDDTGCLKTMLAFIYLTNELKLFTMKIYLTFNVRLYVPVHVFMYTQDN